MAPLLVPIAVAALALLVLVADIAPAEGSSRGIGALAALGLFAIAAFAGVAPLGEVMGGAWVNDAFTVFAMRLVLVAGALSCVASIDGADRGFPRRQGEYHLLLLSSVLGMTLLAGTRDLVLLIVAFELMSIPQYALAAIRKDGSRTAEGAIKLYLTGALSAGLAIYGASFLVGVAGSSSLAEIAAVGDSPMRTFGLLLLLAGLSYKLGAVPFHGWVPDTFQSAPAPFVAFLSVAPKVAAMAALLRLQNAGGGVAGTWGSLVVLVAVVTMVLGNLLAIPQTNVRRLLAWSGIGHVGLMLVALYLHTAESAAAVMFYLATYVVSNLGAFFVAEAVGSEVGDELGGWNGLARRSPGLALAMLLALLSLGGIPFVAGFWGKMFLFRTWWMAGEVGLVWLGALLTVVGLFYYLKVARAIYVEPPTDPAPVAVGRPTLVAIVLAMVGVVGLGLLPGPVWQSALAGGAALLEGGGQAYSRPLDTRPTAAPVRSVPPITLGTPPAPTIPELEDEP